MDGTLAIIGSGQMGEALLAGLLSSGAVEATQVVCADARPDRLTELADLYAVRTTDDNAVAIGDADVVLLALKPQVLLSALAGASQAFRADQTVICVAAGITTAALEETIGQVPVVRVMPNTPALVGQGMSVLAAGSHATAAHMDVAESVLSHVGEVARVDESALDAVTAISGSGPAYVFLFAEALIDAGVLQGLPRETATQLAVQTLVGGAAMLADGGHPTMLKEQVTSPGGTTIAALRELENGGFRSAVFDAVEAAKARSQALGRR